MNPGTRVRLTPAARSDAHLSREINDRTGTIMTATAHWVTVEFDGMEARVGLPASNVETIDANSR